MEGMNSLIKRASLQPWKTRTRSVTRGRVSPISAAWLTTTMDSIRVRLQKKPIHKSVIPRTKNGPWVSLRLMKLDGTSRPPKSILRISESCHPVAWENIPLLVRLTGEVSVTISTMITCKVSGVAISNRAASWVKSGPRNLVASGAPDSPRSNPNIAGICQLWWLLLTSSARPLACQEYPKLFQRPASKETCNQRNPHLMGLSMANKKMTYFLKRRALNRLSRYLWTLAQSSKIGDQIICRSKMTYLRRSLRKEDIKSRRNKKIWSRSLFRMKRPVNFMKKRSKMKLIQKELNNWLSKRD